ncbi:MAG: hypothetical protein AB8U20_03885 [Rickettsiales endosymbiont of Dermacentor nuttalli]
MYGHLTAVEELIDHGANIEGAGHIFFPPLYYYNEK